MHKSCVVPPTEADETILPIGRVFDDLPLTIEHLKSCVTLFVIFAIEAWEMMIIVYTAPQIAREMSLDALAIGNLIGAIFLGMGIGSMVWGTVSDRIGRKRTILWSLGLYAVVSLLSAVAPDYWSLYALRLASGLVAAGMLVVTFPYYEELLPVRWRGALTVYLASGWPLGMLCALGITIWLMPWGWRWVLAASSLVSLWLFVVAWLVPESPYWLVGSGRQHEARRVIARLSGGAVQIPEATRLTVEPVSRKAWRQLFSRRFRRLSLLQVVINFTFSWGYWGLQTWLPTLLQARGLSLPESYDFIAISALCMFPGYMTAAYLTSRIGRKKTVIFYIVAAVLAGYAFAAAASLTVVYAANFALAFFSLGAWGVWDTWIGEIYPTSMRMTGYASAILSQRVANVLAPSVVGVLVAQGASFTATTTMINSFMAVAAILALFLPETEGKSLA